MSPNKNAKFFDFINEFQPGRKNHWESVFLQVQQPLILGDVDSVLEFGPNRGLTGAILKYYGIDYLSADIHSEFIEPDFKKSILEFKSKRKFDMVCAFQVLEHNPPEDFPRHLDKLAMLSKKYVYISLPYSGRWFSFSFNLNLPRLNISFSRVFTWNRFLKKTRPLESYRKLVKPFPYHSRHWFEIGDRDFTLKQISAGFKKHQLKINSYFHSNSFPKHCFFLLEKM